METELIDAYLYALAKPSFYFKKNSYKICFNFLFTKYLKDAKSNHSTISNIDFTGNRNKKVDLEFMLSALINSADDKKINSLFFENKAIELSFNSFQISGETFIFCSVENLISEQKFTDYLFYDLFNLSPDAIVLLDLKTMTYLEVNRGFVKLTGFEREEVIGKTSIELSFWADKMDRFFWLEKINSKGNTHFQGRFITKKGKILHGELVSKKIKVDGKMCVITVIRNVTVQVEAENKLIQSEARLKAAIEKLPVMLLAFDDKQNLVMWNKACEETTGYEAKDMLANKVAFKLLVPNPKYRKILMGRWNVYSQKINLNDWVIEMTCKSGEKKLISFSFGYKENPIPGWPAWGIGADVTDLKIQEKIIIENEMKFKIIAHSTNDAIWDWDLKTDEVWWNDGMRKIFGYSHKEANQKINWWQEQIHEDDRAGVIVRITNAVIQGDTYWSDEYRFLKKDKSIAYVFDKGQIIRDEKGRAIRMVGGMLDTSDRKESETILRDQHKKLRDYAFINSHVVRAPLARIIGLANLLKNENLPDDVQTIINYLTDSSKELDTVIREIASVLAQSQALDQRG